MATSGTAATLRAVGLECQEVSRVSSTLPGEMNVMDLINAGKINLIINTPSGDETQSDGFILRTAAVQHGLTYVTTLAAAQAMVIGMEVASEQSLDIIALQDLPQWE